nr:hypothetical protein [Candidatus Sigynarchaeota archaeon]
MSLRIEIKSMLSYARAHHISCTIGFPAMAMRLARASSEFFTGGGTWRILPWIGLA